MFKKTINSNDHLVILAFGLVNNHFSAKWSVIIVNFVLREPDYGQDQREKLLKQKLFQEVDPQIKQMILSRGNQKPFDKMLEIAQEITDDLDAKR